MKSFQEFAKSLPFHRNEYPYFATITESEYNSIVEAALYKTKEIVRGNFMYEANEKSPINNETVIRIDKQIEYELNKLKE